VRRVYLGVDGGNTKTLALVATADGAIVGAGRGGPCDIYDVAHPDAAIGNVLDAVRDALAGALERRLAVVLG